MRRLRPSLLLPLVLSLLSSPVPGQGVEVYTPATRRDQARVARSAETVAACVVRANSGIDEFLSSVPGDGQLLPLLPISRAGCSFPNGLIPHAFHLRGAIAERLLLRDFTSIGAQPRYRPARIFTAVSEEFLAAASPYTRSVHAMLRLGNCMSTSDPQQTYALFRTRLASPEETAAFNALLPVISGCIDQGQELEITVRSLRPVLAEAAYRTAVIQAQGIPRGE